MPQDVPNETFFNQIGNTTVRAVLTTTATLPSSISPSMFLLSLTDGLAKAQTIFNSQNGSLPNINTVSGREVGPTVVKTDGSMQVPVFYTVGGNFLVDPTNLDPIIL